ncbi:endoribonuclease L-PSP [Caballeronia calidae]|uniref:Endoribonuclease L-PSP n=1 Tax=Caballeronia calidae TaxID=1777139 RepID=A0A158EJ87_9BURK|nr:RidA family protein [Caballeronia calidae]SAL06790.1 endoribonuclease L-PSP [Caballeronia calidae]
MSNIIRKGARGSRYVVHEKTLYVGGQTASDLSAGVAAQVREALGKVDRILVEAGSDRTKVLSAMLWIKNMADFKEMNAEWDQWVDSENPPVRCCGALEMADPRMLFEVVITAAI